MFVDRSGAYGIFELCDVLLQVLAVLDFKHTSSASMI
jgi:hypothetical protein